MQEFKFARFLAEQKADPKVQIQQLYRLFLAFTLLLQLEYHNPRLQGSYGETALALDMFANGEDS